MPSARKKGEKRLRDTLSTILVSGLVLAFFAVPGFMTLNWIKQVVLGPSDPRKVATVAPLATRPYDKQHPALKPFEEPIVSVTFDDGWENIYTTALPILQDKGFPTTQYLIGGVFDNPLYMSVDQARSMRQAGHEIGSHSMTHANLTMITEANLAWELAETKRVLREELGAQVKEFASPLGAFNARTLAAIAANYRSHRDTEGDPNTVNELDVNIKDKWDIYGIKSYSVRNTTTLEDIRKLVDYAVAHKGWLVLTYHQVAPDVAETGEEFGVTPDNLRRQLDLISGRPIRAATMGQVLDAYDRQYGSPGGQE